MLSHHLLLWRFNARFCRCCRAAFICCRAKPNTWQHRDADQADPRLRAAVWLRMRKRPCRKSNCCATANAMGVFGQAIKWTDASGLFNPTRIFEVQLPPLSQPAR